MSRYNVPCYPTIFITVGWDDPLETFFGMVYRFEEGKEGDGEDDGLILWVGADPRIKLLDIPSLEAALKIVLPEGLPKEIKSKLEKDFQLRSPPSPLQMRMRKLFE